MPLPSAKMKINKDGVKFESNVDAIKYALVELERAALRDTAKFIRKRMIEKLKVLQGMKKIKGYTAQVSTGLEKEKQIYK